MTSDPSKPLAQNGNPAPPYPAYAVLPGVSAPLGTAPGADAAGEQVNILKVLHRLLRGRIILAIVLCALGAAVGAAVGWSLKTPMYKAEGLIRVQPVLPKILYNTEQTTVQPMFYSFVNTQANLLQHSRVIARALNSDGWKDLGRERGPEWEKQFRESLRVTTAREAPELIFVSFTDEQSRAAFLAVQEVITAYQELFGGAGTKGVREMQVSALNQRRTTLQAQKRDLENKISMASAEFETDDLSRLHEHYFTQLLAIDQRVTETRLLLAEFGIDPSAASAPAGSAQEQSPGPAQPAPMTVEQIAAADPMVARLLEEQSAIERRLARLRQQGHGEKHPMVIAESAALDDAMGAVRRAIERYASRPTPVGPAAIDTVGPADPSVLLERHRQLRAQSDAIRATTETISRRRREIEGFRREAQATELLLAETERRLDEIAVESKVEDRIGRIEVIMPDGPPSSPNVDPRKKLAAAGFVLGGGFPFGLLLLLGLADRRLRFAEQASDHDPNVPMLGVLPELPSKDADEEEAEAAAHSVHHIRTLLQISHPSHSVYAVTSPTMGDGKTALTLALGMSFTAAGSRTLIIDFDLVGRGLSTRMGVRNATGTGHALISGDDSGLIVETGVPGLSILPAGLDEDQRISRISKQAVSAMIERHRLEYDTILIDTGPVLGSLEANLAASVADGVILVVGRGQQAARVNQAVRHLRTITGHVAGLVFNKARSTDFARSLMSASYRSVGSRSQGPKEVPAESEAMLKALDPVARRVALDLHR